MKKKFPFLLILLLSLQVSAQKLTVSNLVCEYKDNPIGLDVSRPRLSWKLHSKQHNVQQTAYEIRVGKDPQLLTSKKNLIWETGKVNSNQSVQVPYSGSALKPKQRYYWQVRVWDNHGNKSSWSTKKFWETGLMDNEQWSAKWIEADEITDGKIGPAPMFFKSFNINGDIKSARLYITSHGLYDAKLNGKEISDHLLQPGWTSYRKRLQYQAYDVTSLLKRGSNNALVTVGDGWYRGFLEWRNERNWYGKEVGLLYQLEITTTDGKKQTVNSDGSWKSSFEGPIKASDIYNGETFDSRLAKTITNETAAKWNGVRVMDYNLDNIVGQEGPPVVKHEQFKPVKFIETPKGETVIDFGQNLVGWVQVKINGKVGDSLKIDHAEVLDKEGNFYTDNLRAARQEDIFILDGTQQVLEPHFTFHGFRYVKVTGYHGTLDKDNFTAIAIYSDMEPTGSFTSSNKLVNQLQHNIQWGQKGNFVDIPTDCPQRDERLGWTGDAQVFFNTAAYNMNVASFFTKWLQDLKADQYANGNVPVVIPFTHKRKNDGSAGWANASTIIPWNFYTIYGDKRLLNRQYQSMKEWVEYLHSISKNNLWKSGGHYGDWLFYTMADDRDGKAAITDKYLIAQTFYAGSLQNLIDAAKTLGKSNDADKYTSLLDDVKDAFMNEYVTPSGRLVSSSQTAYVLALNFDMLPEALRGQAAERLVDNIKSYKNHLTTGFLGTPYLSEVLTRFGHTDMAYKLLLQKTYPSWLYPVKKGATTIWERWDGIKTDGSFQATSMNSFNHYAYGAIGDWMYKVIAGINVVEPGYKTMRIAPKPGGDFTSASAGLETVYGKIKSQWNIKDGKFIFDVTIPANTTAKIVLPHAAAASITSGTNEIHKDKALKGIAKSGNDLELSAGSGSYHFEYLMPDRL